MDIRKSRLFAESWNIAYRMKAEGAILSDTSSVFTIIPNPVRYWVADPIAFFHNGETYLFAELFDYVTSKGVIGVCTFRDGHFSKWTVILKEKTHLSYPFVFEDGNTVYMIPESSGSKQLVLYKAVNFPYKWDKVKIIKDNVEFVDTTIVREGENYWGFTETRDVPPVDYFIRLDSSFKILEMIKFEAGGDNRHRCGGRIFHLDSKIVSVCQDCVGDYGKGLYFRLIDENLNEMNEFYIDPSTITLNKKMLKEGLHTYSATEKVEVIDIKTKRFSIVNFVFRLLGKIKMSIGGK